VSELDVFLERTEERRTGKSKRAIPGGAFVLDAPEHVPAIWGADDQVLWARDEALMCCGPQGVGKSTIAQQIVRARLGLAGCNVLGYPVEPGKGHVLYIAGDRPSQIARSMRRMFTETDRETLDARLIVWKGQLPFDLANDPSKLAALALKHQADTLVIDSLKDIAPSLSDETVGSAINRAIQLAIEAGVQVLTLHHQRKSNADNRRPRTLSDVYGSGWLTAGHGSVFLLWGEPGDPLVELAHLKQPAEEVGPLDLSHDHEHGETTRRERPSAWSLLQAATNGGVSAKDAAAAIYDRTPTPAQTEKARRQLEKLTIDGYAVRVDPVVAGAAILYRPVSLREGQRDPLTPGSRTLTNPHNNGTRDPHAPSHAAQKTPNPLKGAGLHERDTERDPTANLELTA
jgi:replicative DNA helicase